MSPKDKYDFKIINEFKNELNANNILIHIYTLPVKDIEDKHSENGSVRWNLKKINKDNPYIVFFANQIASFYPINTWEEEYNTHEYRNIDINNYAERQLLQRLILEDINIGGVKSGYKYTKDGLFIKQPVYNDKNMLGFRKFNFDVNTESNGDIIIGYNVSMHFEYINTIEKDIQQGTIKQGDSVKDFYKGGTYKFIEVADFTIGEKNEYLKDSIVNYYIRNGQKHIIDKLNHNMKAIIVSSDKGGKSTKLTYIPSMLKKQVKNENLPYNANRMTKMTPTERMKLLNNTIQNIAANCIYVKYNRANRYIHNLGYKDILLETPKFKFNNGKISTNIANSLFSLGSYESKSIQISYFIDPDIVKNNNLFEEVKKFTNKLEETSLNAKVNLIRNKSGVNFKEIRTDNKDIFELELRNIVSNYKGASIFIMSDENGEKYYNSVKKIFGNKNSIPTQFIYASTVKNANYAQNEYVKKMIYANILLGIYGKSGVQPFVLEKELSADCYVGLDVSRENGVNTAGIVQVIGKDGRVIKSKAIHSAQRGEKIHIDTIKEILLDAISSHKLEYGYDLKHIVFHRDGLNLEEVEALTETAKNLNVKFDYVEITKGVERRIARTDLDSLEYLPNGNVNAKSLKLKTEIGGCFIKGDMAYMVTTNPRETVGMAQPIRVRKIAGTSNIDDICKDVYNLSYMHIGSINKSRLPVTTYYADLSSTYGNRGLIPTDMDGEELHFI